MGLRQLPMLRTGQRADGVEQGLPAAAQFDALAASSLTDGASCPFSIS